MAHLVRAVMLTGYYETARFVGLDPAAMLRRFRISPRRLSDPENRLPAMQVVDLLEETARQSGCTDFGILMAACRTFPSLGPLSLLLEHLQCLSEVVQEVSNHRRHINDILVLGMEEVDGAQLIKVDLDPKFASPQTCLLTLGVAQVVLIGASRHRWRPEGVHFIQDAPVARDNLRRFFPARLEFGAHFNGFSCPASMMFERWPWANELMAQHARRLLKLVPIQPEECPFSESVKRSIVLLLPSGGATLANVASLLGMSERKLQRELVREDNSFAALLNDARRELSFIYLGSSRQSVTSVAECLGYSSPSSFTRWFSEEFGMSPKAWRIGNSARRSNVSDK